jgi:hypothetical protein
MENALARDSRFKKMNRSGVDDVKINRRKNCYSLKQQQQKPPVHIWLWITEAYYSRDGRRQY